MKKKLRGKTQTWRTSKSLPEFILGLTEAQHDTGLGNNVLLPASFLGLLQDRQALPKSRPPVPDVRRQALNGLDVVREDVEAAIGHQRDHVEVAAEVARQRLDEQGRLLLLDLADGLDQVPGAAIGQVVAVDGG